jgi:hypothetical protein
VPDHALVEIWRMENSGAVSAHDARSGNPTYQQRALIYSALDQATDPRALEFSNRPSLALD